MTTVWERNRVAFREDYTDWRTWGWTHTRIAAHLGIQRESLLRRCVRYGIYLPETEEQVARERLDHLIASGRPFTVDDMPRVAPSIRGGVIRHAHCAGLIEQVGSTVGPQGGVTGQHRIWRAVATSELAVAS
ncbi:hypothetical protein [Rhodococcoides fascians]|uniref:hypothetical protein n=1 Tax=Rhodococcoides fascians TaxID=1828 RepID=UPI0012D2B46A|nr:hypothetical protein [Rhodococcus fascians]